MPRQDKPLDKGVGGLIATVSKLHLQQVPIDSERTPQFFIMPIEEYLIYPFSIFKALQWAG